LKCIAYSSSATMKLSPLTLVLFFLGRSTVAQLPVCGAGSGASCCPLPVYQSIAGLCFCFCDAVCPLVGDCCPDYGATCPQPEPCDGTIEEDQLPDMSYKSLSLFYEANNVSPPPRDADICVEFDYNGANNVPVGTTYEAVIYPQTNFGGSGDPGCDFTSYISKTDGAHLALQTTNGPTNSPAFFMWFDDNARKLYIDTPFAYFNAPNEFWDLSANQLLGLLGFCVEIQAHFCDDKIDFIDVAIDVEFDLESECTCEEGNICDDCPVVAELIRDDPDIVDGNVGPYDITCELCPDSPQGPFGPGDPITICICLTDEDVLDDACIADILTLAMGVLGGTFSLIPAPQLALLVEGSLICDDPDYPDCCKITFVPSATFQQELASSGTTELEISGSARVGLGTEQCEDNRRNLQEDSFMADRELQSTILNKFVADPFEVTFVATDGTKSCDDNPFLALLQLILGWFLAIFGIKFCE